MEITSKPLPLDELDRRILQLEMERVSLSKAAGKDRGAAARLGTLDGELSGLRERQQALAAQWESERSDMMRLTQIKEEVERVNLEIQQVRLLAHAAPLGPRAESASRLDSGGAFGTVRLWRRPPLAVPLSADVLHQHGGAL